jgi:ribonucleotide reductase alpha subunit
VTLLQQTITASVRMLDNAVDLSWYPTARSQAASLEERPIGLGVAGFTEALERLNLRPGSAAAAEFADWSMELVSYFAVLASAELAGERGAYPNYASSKWSRGLLPLDTLALLSTARGLPVGVSSAGGQDWELVRAQIQRHGLRHCATTAVGSCGQPALVAGLDLAAGEGKVDPHWLIECAARRQKWIDMGHTLDLPVAEGDLGKIGHFYMEAWEKGLKTTRQLVLVPAEREHAETRETAAEGERQAELAAAAD